MRSTIFQFSVFFAMINLTILCHGQADTVFSPIIPKGYVTYKVNEPIIVDGQATEASWNNAEWTDLFQDIEGSSKAAPYFDTRAKILWDDENIYFFFLLQENHVWADIDQRDQVIFYNNDIEIFLKPYSTATHYCELEVNSLGTVWDLLLANAYRAGGPIINNWDIKNLEVGIDVNGSLNNASDIDSNWTAEIAIPWQSLDQLLYGKKHKAIPDPWRLNFSRVQWEYDVSNGNYSRKKEGSKFLPEKNWVWSPQGVVDMHRPEHWGYLVFSDKEPGTIEYQDNPSEEIVQYLFAIYRNQRFFKRKHGRYARNIGELEVPKFVFEGELIKVEISITNFGFEVSTQYNDQVISVNHNGELSQKSVEPFVYGAWCHGNAKKSDAEWAQLFIDGKKAGISDYFIGASKEELVRYIGIADTLDLKIHGWIWTLNRPGDTIAQQHPEWYAVNRKGQNSLEYNAYVGYYQWLSPFSEGAREYIKSNIKELSEIEGLESIHLDYVRYCDVILGKALQPKYNLVQDREMPEYDYGYHPNARAGFMKTFGRDPLEMKNPELSTEWRQYRLNAVTSLVNELAEISHAASKKISAAVFPFPEMSRSMVRQDWSSWNIDIALPMIYHNFYEENLDWIQFATEQGVGEVDGRFHLYTGLYVPALTPEELREAILKAKAGGAKGISLFNYNSLSGEHLKILEELSKE